MSPAKTNCTVAEVKEMANSGRYEEAAEFLKLREATPAHESPVRPEVWLGQQFYSFESVLEEGAEAGRAQRLKIIAEGGLRLAGARVLIFMRALAALNVDPATEGGLWDVHPIKAWYTFLLMWSEGGLDMKMYDDSKARIARRSLVVKRLLESAFLGDNRLGIWARDARELGVREPQYPHHSVESPPH
jgi:hypothetical protein